MKLSYLRNVLKDLSFIFFSAFLLLLLCELILKALNFPLHSEIGFVSNYNLTKIDPVAGISYKKNIKNSLPGYPGALFTDFTGYIHNGTPREIKAIEGGVFIFGGSTVEGRGSTSNYTTISAKLESCLQEKYKKLQVINAGFSGDYSYQAAQRALFVIGHYKPKAVIFLDGRNDAHYSLTKGWHAFDSNVGIKPLFIFLMNFLIEVGGR